MDSKPEFEVHLWFIIGFTGFCVPIQKDFLPAQMSVVTQQPATIEVILLLVFALAKIVALSGTLNFGFIGGPIFPLLFVVYVLGL